MTAVVATGGVHVESLGAGPPLVLLHGWGLHAGLFSPLLPALARRSGVRAVDLPGHGRSAPIVPCTLDAMVDAVAGALAGVTGPLAVLGWSLGGLVAMRWAARDPARVSRLVLVTTSPRFAEGPDWPHAIEAATLARFGDELEAAWRPTLQRFLTLQVQGSEEGRSTLALMRHHLHARGDPSPGALRGALEVLASTDLRDEVRGIRTPALVIAGGRDTLVPAAAGEWLAHALPHATYVRIEGAAHAPFLSHRAAFDGALGGFLDAR